MGCTKFEKENLKDLGKSPRMQLKKSQNFLSGTNHKSGQSQPKKFDSYEALSQAKLIRGKLLKKKCGGSISPNPRQTFNSLYSPSNVVTSGTQNRKAPVFLRQNTNHGIIFLKLTLVFFTGNGYIKEYSEYQGANTRAKGMALRDVTDGMVNIIEDISKNNKKIRKRNQTTSNRDLQPRTLSNEYTKGDDKHGSICSGALEKVLGGITPAHNLNLAKDFGVGGSIENLEFKTKKSSANPRDPGTAVEEILFSRNFYDSYLEKRVLTQPDHATTPKRREKFRTTNLKIKTSFHDGGTNGTWDSQENYTKECNNFNLISINNCADSMVVDYCDDGTISNMGHE